MTTDNKPNVLLLYPKTGLDYGSSVAPPHSLLTIAAPVLKAGYNVRILDQRTQTISKKILEDLISDELLCIGISTMIGTQIKNAIGLAKIVRELTDGSVPIVFGGPMPSVIPEQTIAHELVDIVVNGEADESFLELVQALDKKTPLSDIKGILFKDAGKVVNTGGRLLLDVESLLPTPWELVNVENYIHRDAYLRDKYRVLDIGQTSRGCPFNCGFCSSASIRERKWRAMSVEKSIAFIESDINRFNLDGFWLRDDEFYIKRKRAHAIFEEMIERDLGHISWYTAGTRADVFMKASENEIDVMKRAGAHTLKFGAESGSQRILDLMKKDLKVEQTLAANIRCRDHGIVPTFSLMVGYPTETFEEMNSTIDLAFQLKKDNPLAQVETINTYTATPGTPDMPFAIEHGLRPPETLEGWGDWLFDDYDFEGKHSPWYSKQERIQMGNISYMSILSNVMQNVVGSGKSRFFTTVNRGLAMMIGKFYSWKLKNKRYKYAPELALARAFRRKIFYENKSPFFETWMKFPKSFKHSQLLPKPGLR